MSTPASHDSATPAPGQQVITACAFLHRKVDGVERVFLPRRAATKKFLPNVYELPGGHIEFGESMEDGLRRELREELSISVDVGDPFAAFTYLNEVKGSHSIEVIYFVTSRDPIEQITLNPDDHSTAGWFTVDELAQVYGVDKGHDDPEYRAVRRGFALLAAQE